LLRNGWDNFIFSFKGVHRLVIQPKSVLRQFKTIKHGFSFCRSRRSDDKREPDGIQTAEGFGASCGFGHAGGRSGEANFFAPGTSNDVIQGRQLWLKGSGGQRNAVPRRAVANESGLHYYSAQYRTGQGVGEGEANVKGVEFP